MNADIWKQNAISSHVFKWISKIYGHMAKQNNAYKSNVENFNWNLFLLSFMKLFNTHRSTSALKERHARNATLSLSVSVSVLMKYCFSRKYIEKLGKFTDANEFIVRWERKPKKENETTRLWVIYISNRAWKYTTHKMRNTIKT